MAKLSESEVRAEFEKLQAHKQRQRAYRNRPEVKARQAEHNVARAARRKAVLAEAEKLGLKLE